MFSTVLNSRRTRIVVSAFLTQALVLGGVFSYGIFIPALQEDLGWSRTLLSASPSVAFLVMGVLAMLAGKLNDRFGPRSVLSVSGVICGLGFVLMSIMQSPWQLMIGFGLFVGIGLSTHDVVTLSTVAQWFQQRRGVMTAVVKVGTACGQMSVPLLATFLYLSLGWRSALLIMGLGIGLGLLLVAQFMQAPDQPGPRKADSSRSVVQQTAPSSDADSDPDSDRDSNPDSTPDVNPDLKSGVSYSDAKRSKTLWILCAIQFCFFPALMTVPLHMVAHAIDLGMTAQGAASVLSALGASSIIGRLLVGFLFDKTGGKPSMMACLSVLSIGLLLLLLIQQPGWLYLCAFIYGSAHGGLFTVVSPTVAEYFGMQAHGAIFGTIVFFGTLAGATGPILAGLIFDTTHSYQLAFQILLALAITALALSLALQAKSSLGSPAGAVG